MQGLSFRGGRGLTGRALLSAFFSYAGTLLLDLIPGGVALFRNSGVYLAGVLFGALVMAPAVPAEDRRAGVRRAAAVVLGALIYYAAVKLAMYQAVTLRVQEMIACGLSGAAGAAAVGAASRWLLSVPVSPRRITKAAAAGGLTGTLFGINGTFHVPDFSQALVLIAGFMAWQAAVALALFRKEPEGVAPASSRSS